MKTANLLGLPKAWRVSTRSRQSDEKFRLTFDLWVIQRDRCLQHGATDTRVSIPSEPSLFAQTTPSFGFVNSLNRVPIRSLSLPRHWVPFQGSSHRDTAVIATLAITQTTTFTTTGHGVSSMVGCLSSSNRPNTSIWKWSFVNCLQRCTALPVSSPTLTRHPDIINLPARETATADDLQPDTPVDDEGDGTDNGIYTDSDAIPDDDVTNTSGICDGKSEMGNYTVKARFGCKRTHNEELCVASCGVILGRATFFGSEGPNGVRTFWMKIFPVKAALPSVLFYDNNCRIVSMLTNDDDRRLRHYFDNCALPVDVFHFKCKHKETGEDCGRNCNRYIWPELRTDDGRWRFNSGEAEGLGRCVYLYHRRLWHCPCFALVTESQRYGR
ncbi:hypothetical protein BGW80DRAFT_515685 [Lactifluus volemus]|nr:hypothetical protein BGW80DRAFT_515685 [Lactifluus volemus]